MNRKERCAGDWRDEKPIWIIGIVLFLLLLGAEIVEWLAPGLLEQSAPTCFVRRHVGMYCTGCGATRAVLAVLHGQFLRSLYFNGIVMYVIVFYGIYVLRGALYLMSRGRYRYMRFRPAYVFVGLGIVIAQAVVKNVSLFVYHYTWMS